MSFLTLIWVLSLATLIGVVVYAFVHARKVTAPRYIPRDMSEFVHEALTHLAGGVSSVADSAKPHAERAVSSVVAFGKLGHDKFIDRVFGKTEQVRGKTASFFLKYIAEHKEEVRGTPEQRAGLEK